MSNFTPGEFLQEFFTDTDGIKYDAKTGNRIEEPQGAGRINQANDIAYVTARGQVLRYQDVYKQRGDVQKYASVYPGPSNVHVNKALTDISVAYEVDSGLFVAPEVAPVSTQDKRSDAFFIWNGDDVTRDYGNNLNWAIGGTANEVNQGFTTSTYQAVLYGARDFIPDKVASNADQALQLASTQTTFLTSVVEISIDRRTLVNRVMSPVQWASHTTSFSSATIGGSGTINTATNTNRYIHQAFNYVKSLIAQSNSGKLPTHFVTNMDVAQRIAASVEIADQIKLQMGKEYVTNGGWAGPNHGLPAELYGLKTVVSSLPTNSAQRGQTASYSFLAPGSIAFLVVEQPGLKTRNTCTQFRVGGLMVRSYRDEPRMGQWVEVSVDQDENITNNVGAYLLTSA